jgi:hypothetical protein
LSVSYNPSAKTLAAFTHSLNNETWKFMTTGLASSPHLSAHPLYLPVLLFLHHAQRENAYRGSIDNNVFATERETKFGAPGRVAPHVVPPSEFELTDHGLDLGMILRRLHSCQTELSSLTHVCKFSQLYGEFLAGLCKGMIASARSQGDEDLVAHTDEILDLLQLPLAQTNTILNQVQGLKERVQSQTTLVGSG